MNTSTTKDYYGTCEKSFKERYNNHTSSLRNKSRQKSAKLSNYIWELKQNGENHTIDWLIASKDLCLCEKLLIARANSASLLNKRDELVSKCRHMNKFTLKCFKNKQSVILMILLVTICSFRFRYKTNIVDHLMIG